MPLPAIAAGALIGAAIADRQNAAAKKAYAAQGHLASTQSAWSGLTGHGLGEVKGDRPNYLADVSSGAAKGALMGLDAKIAWDKSRMPAANNVVNVGNTSVTPAIEGNVVETPISNPPTPVRQIPSYQSFDDGLDMYQRRNSVMDAMQRRNPRRPAPTPEIQHEGFRSWLKNKPLRGPASEPPMNPWYIYGGTGGS